MLFIDLFRLKKMLEQCIYMVGPDKYFHDTPIIGNRLRFRLAESISKKIATMEEFVFVNDLDFHTLLIVS